MLTFRRNILSGLLFLAPSLLFAAPQTYSLSGFHAKNQIAFFSKATVEDFEGTASDVAGSVAVDFSKPNLNLRAVVSVPVHSMSTGLTLKDTHMKSREWLDAEHYPVIQFTLLPATKQKVVRKGNDEWVIQSVGEFTLKGQSKQITVPVVLKKNGDDILIKGQFLVPIQEFGIRGPTATRIIGLKVSSDVKVTFKLVGKTEKGW